jgi:hypothetical protein
MFHNAYCISDFFVKYILYLFSIFMSQPHIRRTLKRIFIGTQKSLNTVLAAEVRAL